MNKKRPKHLALHQIKLPLPGIVSILHRVSGLLLFIALPLLLLMLQYSLRLHRNLYPANGRAGSSAGQIAAAGSVVGVPASLLRRAALSGDRPAPGARSCPGAQQQQGGDGGESGADRFCWG